MVLLIQEILQKYYSTELREGIKTLKTSFRMPHGILFHFRYFYFCGISMKTAILVSYSFLYFTAWLLNINNSGVAMFNILATSNSCGNIWVFLSTLPIR